MTFWVKWEPKEGNKVFGRNRLTAFETFFVTAHQHPINMKTKRERTRKHRRKLKLPQNLNIRRTVQPCSFKSSVTSTLGSSGKGFTRFIMFHNCDHIFPKAQQKSKIYRGAKIISRIKPKHLVYSPPILLHGFCGIDLFNPRKRCN